MKEPSGRTFVYVLLVVTFLFVVASEGPPTFASPPQKGAALAAQDVSKGAVPVSSHGITAASRPEPKRESAQAAGKGDGDYVGSETCVACHQDQEKTFKVTIMGKAMARPHTALEKRGCEACHGPGKAHVEAGGSKESIPVRFSKDSKNTVAEKNSSCLDCHARGNQMFWKGSQHEIEGVACTSCHKVHVGDDPVMDKVTQTDVCLNCHKAKRAELRIEARWRLAWRAYLAQRWEEAARDLAALASDTQDPIEALRARYWEARALDALRARPAQPEGRRVAPQHGLEGRDGLPGRPDAEGRMRGPVPKLEHLDEELDVDDAAWAVFEVHRATFHQLLELLPTEIERRTNIPWFPAVNITVTMSFHSFAKRRISRHIAQLDQRLAFERGSEALVAVVAGDLVEGIGERTLASMGPEAYVQMENALLFGFNPLQEFRP